MTIKLGEIKLYKSLLITGGGISDTEISSGDLHNLFDIVDVRESLSGTTQYRCFYIKNTNQTESILNLSIQITDLDVGEFSEISIGKGIAGVGEDEEILLNDTIPPIDVVFSDELLTETELGAIPPNSYIGVWLSRTTDSGILSPMLQKATLKITINIVE